MERDKSLQKAKFVDLRTFDPYEEFVPKLRDKINVKGAGSDSAVPSKAISVLQSELSPNKLHIDAVRPAIDAVLSELKPRKKYDKSEDGVEDIRTPAERTVYEYLKEITNTVPKELRDDNQREVQERYEKSSENYYYFLKFNTLIERRKSGKKTIFDIESNWKKMQEREPDKVKIDRVQIANNWRTLRNIISEEVDLDAKVRNSVRRNRKYIMSNPFWDEDPRVQGSQQLELDAMEYNIRMANIGEARATRLSTLSEVLEGIISIPGQISAEVLWQNVLSDEEKQKIQNEKSIYRKADSLIKDSEHFLSYKEKAFHEFDARNNGFHNTWADNILNVQHVIGNMERILIGDTNRAPFDTKDLLRGPEYSIDNIFLIPQVEAAKRSKLHGYVADVTTALLMRGSDKDRASSI